MNETKNLYFFAAKKYDGDAYLLTTIAKPKYIRRMTSGSGADSSVVGEYVVKCPFHEEKTPSCIVFKKYDGPNAGECTFHCIGCGKSGKCTLEEIKPVEACQHNALLEEETLDEIRLFGSGHLLEILGEVHAMFKGAEDDIEPLNKDVLLAYFYAIIRYAISLDNKLKSK